MPDIKNVNKAIDTNDRYYYRNCTDEERASFPMWTYQRWCSSTQNYTSHALVMTNELVNVDHNILSKDHPELLWMCMSLTGVGRVGYHPWIKPPKGQGKKDAVLGWLIEIKPLANMCEIEMLRAMNTNEELIEYAKTLGCDDDKIKEIFNVGKKRRKPKR